MKDESTLDVVGGEGGSVACGRGFANGSSSKRRRARLRVFERGVGVVRVLFVEAVQAFERRKKD